MLEKIDHIGIAVRDWEQALARYAALTSGPPQHIEELPAQKVRVAMFEIGASHVELLLPTAPDSPIAKFLEKRGEGMHHICFKVPNLDAALRKLQADGMEVLPGAGSPGANNSRVAFLHPKSAAGVLIELVEKNAD